MTTLTEDATKKRRARSCPECKSTHLVERLDEECTVCLDCGFVISAETANRNSNRKTNTDQHKRVRPTSSSAKAASSIENKEPNHENMIRTLEKWRQIKIGDSTEKNLALALQYTTKIAVDLSLPKIALEKASLTYKKIIEKGLLKGRSMRAISATAVYIGCKQCRTAITIRDIAHASKISPKKISHSYRSIVKHLDFSMQLTSASNHAIELSARLQVSTRTMEVVEKTIEALDCSKGLVGKSPTGIACAAIYIGSLLTGERRTQREIAEVGRITEATIRARCRELERSLIFSVDL
jgi:transcription initiation factor TFIIB